MSLNDIVLGVKSGDEKSVAYLIEEFTGVVKSHANRFTNQAHDFDDFFQIGITAVVLSATKVDLSKCGNIGAYLAVSSKNAMLSEIDRLSRRTLVSNAHSPDESGKPNESLSAIQSNEESEIAMRFLRDNGTDRQIDIIVRIGKDETRRFIAESHGVSESTISRDYKAALAIMKSGVTGKTYCRQCHAETSNDFSCDICLGKQRVQQTRFRKHRIANSLCIRCGVKTKAGSECDMCAQKTRDRSAKQKTNGKHTHICKNCGVQFNSHRLDRVYCGNECSAKSKITCLGRTKKERRAFSQQQYLIRKQAL